MTEQHMIAVDGETHGKLLKRSIQLNRPIIELVRMYANALDKLMGIIQEGEGYSVTDFAVDLKTSTLKQHITPLLSIDQLPNFVQRFYVTQKRIEDLELSGVTPTREMLVKEGFEFKTVDLLFSEREQRAKLSHTERIQRQYDAEVAKEKKSEQ